MSKMFPIFLDLENKRIHIYGAGRIASRRVKTLQLFGPRMIVHAPEASCQIQKAADEGVLMLRRECYQPGSIPADVFFVQRTTARATNRSTGSAGKKGFWSMCAATGTTVIFISRESFPEGILWWALMPEAKTTAWQRSGQTEYEKR